MRLDRPDNAGDHDSAKIPTGGSKLANFTKFWGIRFRNPES